MVDLWAMSAQVGFDGIPIAYRNAHWEWMPLPEALISAVSRAVFEKGHPCASAYGSNCP